jgi:hypothetical protein
MVCRYFIAARLQNISLAPGGFTSTFLRDGIQSPVIMAS